MKLDKKLLILAGVICAVEGWKIIWKTCNLVHIWKAKIPTIMPHLSESAEKHNLMMESPFDRKYGIILEVFGVKRRHVYHMDLVPGIRLGELYKLALIGCNGVYIGVCVILLCTTLAKLYFGYHPFIYKLTSRITEDKQSRALLFFAFDNFINRSCPLIVELIKVSMTDPGEFSMIHMSVTWNAILVGMSVLIMYFLLHIKEQIGSFGWSLIPIIFKGLEILLTIAVISALKLVQEPPQKPSDLNTRLESLLATTKYPKLAIRENFSDRFPMVNHYSSLFNDVIAYTPQILTRLPNDQITSIVAHEIGKRKYFYWPYYYFVDIVKTLAISCVTIKSFDSLEIDEMFGFLDDLPHPAISLYLGHAYILPLIHQVIDWISNVGFRLYIYKCDTYACRQGFSSELKNALRSLAGTSNRYPIFDSPWYSTIMGDVPTVLDRILQIELYEFHQNRKV
ncbi:hypothetical protein GE061_008124 [Apolygus lucorum]|uniref:Uncharacterized protein n=1 Tax=Apolygus lucorum TaxID=248454 RepID=A0A6A4IUK5_APOLU|nr:hypothetical protein GE061_008124 [Apolygus lucorum]